MKRGLLAFSLLALAACDTTFTPTGPEQHETRSVELNHAEMARVEMKMGAGELRVEGGSPQLVDADFTYNVPGWKPMLIDDSTGVRREIRIEQPGSVHAGGNTVYRWNLRLNNDVPMDLVAHLGAGTARMTLGALNLRSVEVEMGVGELHLDLTGTPRRDYNVNLQGGVGQATILVPASVGIEAHAQGGIGQISVKGLEKRGDSWINPAHEQAPVTIHLSVEGGVGQINIVAQ